MSSTKRISFQIDAQDNASATLSRVKRELENVSKASGKVSSSVSGFGSTFSTEIGLLSSAASLASKAVLGLGAALTTAGVFAVKSAASYEQQRTAFEAMLGSADEAKKLLREVSDFAAQTPFELPEVVTGAKRLLAFGVSAKDVTKKLTLVGDAAAKMGVPIDQAINVWAKAKAGMFDIAEFAPLGVTREKLEKFGVTFKKTGEVVDRSKLGPALEKFWGSDGTVGMMNRQSKTFTGVMSNISDTIGRFAREVIGISSEGEIREGSIFQRLKDGANSLYSYLEKNKETITKTVTDAVNRAIEKIKLWIAQMGGPEGIKQKFMQFWDTLTNKVIPAIASLVSMIGGAVKWIADHKDMVIKLVAAYEALKLVIWANGAISAVGQLGASLVRLSGTIAGVKAGTGLLRTALLSLPTSIVIAVGIGSILAAIKAAKELKAAVDDVDKANNKAIKSVSELLKKAQSLDKSDPNRKKLLERASSLGQSNAKIMNDYSGSLSLFSLLTGRASGGPVTGKTPYIVGEVGPELFVPNQSGTIIPNDQLSKGSGGDNITINFNNPTVRNDNDLQTIVNAVKQHLKRETFNSRYGIRTA